MLAADGLSFQKKITRDVKYKFFNIPNACYQAVCVFPAIFRFISRSPTNPEYFPEMVTVNG